MKIAIRMLIMLVVAGVIFGGVFFFDSFRAKMIAHYMTTFANPTESVATMTAAMQPWQQHAQAIASLRAVNGAELSADVGGIVDQINFHSGEDVAAGAVLLRLRLEDDTAHLQQLQSAAALAQTNYERDRRQLAAQAVSRATVDTDLSNLQSAQAAVAEQQEAIAKKTIVAPFAGHLGIRSVDLGQYVAAGTAIVTLQSLDPIFADFYIPQQDIGQVKIGQAVTLAVDTYPGRRFAGTIQSLNAQLDTPTRTLQLRAVFPNPDRALLPGMFATATVAIGVPTPFITLPQSAITYNPYGSTVFVVETKQSGKTTAHTAHQIFVQTGQTRGDQVAITSGVSVGQTVVVAGQVKLHNGTDVTINNSLLPSDDANPHPAEQ